MYLCENLSVLEIFGHTGEEAEDIVYVNWLSKCACARMCAVD